MPAARAKSAITSKYDRTQRSQSYSGPVLLDETDSSVSESNDLPIHTNEKAAKQIRHSAQKRASQSNHRGSSGFMATHTPSRAHSDSKTYQVRNSKMTSNDVHRKEESRQRHRARRANSGQVGDGDGVVHQKRQAESSSRGAERGRSHNLRRSRTTGGTSRANAERSQKDDVAPPRRHTEKYYSNHEERRQQIPRWREGRTVAVDESESKDKLRPRSVSVNNTRSSFVFLPFLQRNWTSSQRTPTSNMSSRNVPSRNLPSRHVPESNFIRSKPSPHPAQPVQPSPSRSHMTDKKGQPESTARGSRAADKSSGVFSSMFTSSKGSRPPKLVTCIVCASDDVPASKCPKLECNHRMCNDCLKRLFELSVTDSEHMPPKCCSTTSIPVRLVEHLFDKKFKIKWNKKNHEFSTKNRVYCPSRNCGTWIKPEYIHRDRSGGATHGRKYGTCKRCNTKVCCACNNKWHKTRDCPNDPATKEFVKMAKEKGWQECYNCKAVVELKEGCNHMTCKCKAEFCMACGAKWWTCGCKIFSDEVHNEGEVPPLNPAAAERAYRERRREQERRDEAMARRMQELGMDQRRRTDFDFLDDHDRFFMNQDSMRELEETWNIRILPMDQAPGRRAAARMPEHTTTQQPLRQQLPASEHYNANRAPGRQNERAVPRRNVMDHATEAEIHRPIVTEARASLLAGMARGQSGDGRVNEWRRHVDPL